MSVRLRAHRFVHVLTLTALTVCSASAALGVVTLTPASARTATGTQTFFDTFNGPAGVAPNPSVWTPQVGGNWANGQELAYLTNRPENAHLTGRGTLLITAKGQTYTGWDATRDYTSARLMTNQAVLYGTISARIKLSGAQGANVAFWTMGKNYQQVGWPKCGELDVMEATNSFPNLYGSFHGPLAGGPSWSYYNQGKMVSPPAGLAGGWHVYSARWTRTQITFLLDGVPYVQILKSDLPADQTWAMDTPQQLILSVGVGGWAGPPAPPATFKATMEVDWVKVTGTNVS